MNSVLIFAYYSIKDPVFQSAVLQYFKHYAPLINARFILVTFEHEKYSLTQSDVLKLEQDLSRYGIKWHRLKWHSGSFKLFKKLFDLIWSLWVIKKLIKYYQIRTIYSEGFPGAIIGYIACSMFKLKHVVHTFEPHADYMLEAGVWVKSSWEYRLLKRFEKKVALHADWILTATNAMKSLLVTWGVNEKRVCLAPSCINTDLFEYSEQDRKTFRDKHNLTKEDKVLVYVGKLGGMYWSEELFEAVKNFASYPTVDFKCLIVTSEDHSKINSELLARGVNPSSYILLNLKNSEVPKYLSVADIALVAVKQQPSKQYCSPIKTGEYLSCGLPVIIPKGISDDFQILEDLGIAVLLNDTSARNLQNLPIEIDDYLQSANQIQIRQAARSYALKNRSLQSVEDTYLRIFEL